MPARIDLRRLLTPAALLFLASCARPPDQGSGVTIETDILPRPVRAGPASVTLKILDDHKKPLTGAQIELEGDMSHPGMAPVFGEAKEAEPGSYRGSLRFTMAGDWVILLHVTLPDGRVLQRQAPVRVAGVD